MKKVFLNPSDGFKTSPKALRTAGTMLAAAALFPALASAQYTVEAIVPPDALGAQAFGINNAGKVTGGARNEEGSFNFIYDIKKQTYTILDDGFAALDINNRGTVVGSVDTECAIRDKKGNVTTFAPPSATAGSFCQARGINSRGDVTGFLVNEDGGWLGFVYNPKRGSFEEFLPSPQTFAQGINAQGEIVGSVFQDENEAFPGSTPGRYGYLRNKNGSVKVFDVALAFPGQTRARGLSDSGLVAGFYVDSSTFQTYSFVTRLTAGTEFETLTLSADEIIYQAPCNPDVPPPPGEGYELFSDFFVQHVRNDGVASGNCFDSYFNAETGDFVQYSSGFIATPVK
jgi:uncharacterized membrane protein